VKEWSQTDTLVILALLMGVALGTASGYTLQLDQLHYQDFDNDTRRNPIPD
jgi:hypothetical protein